jgi:hypothetical protein
MESIPNTSGVGSGSSNSNCTRDNDPDKDEITRVKFRTLDGYRQIRDGWFNGKLELRLFVSYGTIDGVPVTLDKMFINNKLDYRNCGLFNCALR